MLLDSDKPIRNAYLHKKVRSWIEPVVHKKDGADANTHSAEKTHEQHIIEFAVPTQQKHIVWYGVCKMCRHRTLW